MKRKNFLTFRSFAMKLSQRIRLRSNNGIVSASGPQEDTEFFHKTFPFFIWLLRDVTQSIPTDCRDIKEYFLTRVRRLILKRWTEIAKELVKCFPKKRSSSDWKHRKTLCHSRRNIVFSDYTLRVCYMNKIPDCLEKQAHYSSINIQDKKEGVATFSKEWFQGV